MTEVCKGESSVGYKIYCFADIGTEKRNVVIRKLDLDQTSVAHTHTEKIKNKNKKNVIILPGTL